MDTKYWKARCEAAERALQLARSVVPMSERRQRVLVFLADLKADNKADTHRLAALLQCTAERAHTILVLMSQAGLVEREPGRCGRHGHTSRWKLGHMVQVGPNE